MDVQDLFFIFEIIGTVAFAISGALMAIRKKMDIFGVAILGMTTAVAGGIIRDLILGITPPAAFVHPVYALTAIGVSLIMFIPAIRKALSHLGAVLLVMDSIGLAAFTVTGVGAGMAFHNLFLTHSLRGNGHRRWRRCPQGPVCRQPALHLCKTLLCLCFHHRFPDQCSFVGYQ